MATQVNRLENQNIEITFSVPWEEIQKAYNHAVEEAVQETEIPGFRKGKAPKDMVLPKLDKSKLYSHAIQHLLPTSYAAIIKANNLKPIVNPKVTITKGEENSDWEFVATVCEAPEVKLPPDYQTAISKLPKESKDDKIGQIAEYLRTSCQVKVPDLLVEEEANHRLSALIENLTQLGLTTESYLQTKKLKPEDLKAQQATQARVDLELEFILNQIRIDQKLADRKKTLDFLPSLV